MTKADGAEAAEEIEDQSGDDDADDGDGGVLASQVGGSAFLDSAGDLDHPLVAGRGAKHLLAGDDAVNERDDAAGDRDEDQVHELNLPLSDRSMAADAMRSPPIENRRSFRGWTSGCLAWRIMEQVSVNRSSAAAMPEARPKSAMAHLAEVLKGSDVHDPGSPAAATGASGRVGKR